MQEARKLYSRDEVFAASLEYFGGNKLQANVFTDKYALRDRDGQFYELTPDDMHRRLAREFARIERKYPNPLSEETIYSYLQRFSKIVPQGSPMFGIGNDHQLVSLSNCAVIGNPTDNMSSIIDTARDMANLYKRRFGVGVDISSLRPDGAIVNNAAITSTGAWSFMDFYSYVTRMVGQSGRRGALMLSIDARHPDVFKFATAKKDLTKVTGANISIRVTDDFMRAVEEDTDYTLRFPVDAPLHEVGHAEMMFGDALGFRREPAAKFQKKIRARELFDLVAEMAAGTAEPGLLFWDTIKNNLPLDVYEGFETVSTNPCGEIPLPPYDSCRLISIYLASFVRNEFDTSQAVFDMPAFVETVRIAMRLSDDLVDLEIEKLEALRKRADTDDERALMDKFIAMARNGRRTGLGTHGLGDALARLCVKYDSAEGVEQAKRIYRHLKLAAYRESVNLARERGAFPMYDAEKERKSDFIRRIQTQDPVLYEQMVRFGRRNGAILTNAPTGTVSLMSDNCSSGIEPVFAIWYTRNQKIDPNKESVEGLVRDATGDYWRAHKVFHPNVERYLRAQYGAYIGMYRASGVKPDVTFEQFAAETPLPDYFVSANDIDWKYRVEMQAAIQAEIDHSISSTLNLPKGTTKETIAEIYMAAWKAGCKGVTVYVDGCREQQVLSTEEKKPEAPEATTALKDEMTGKLLAKDAKIGDLEAQLLQMRQDYDKLLTRLMEAEDKATPAAPQGLQPTQREVETFGPMTKASFRRSADGRERKVYVYVGKNALGQPVEVFVVDEQGDEDLHPYSSALGKVISLALKFGIKPEDITAAVAGLKGGSISYTDGIHLSVPDLVGKLLDSVQQDYLKGKQTTFITGTSIAAGAIVSGKLTVTEGAYKGGTLFHTGMTNSPTVSIPEPEAKGEQCPSCDSWTLYRIGGCPQCRECGWSKCDK